MDGLLMSLHTYSGMLKNFFDHKVSLHDTMKGGEKHGRYKAD